MQKVTITCPTPDLAHALSNALYAAGYVVATYWYRGTEILTTDAPVALVNEICRTISAEVN
jgi:hypothetical protein